MKAKTLCSTFVVVAMLTMGLGLTSGAQGAAMPKELAPVAIGVMQRDAGPAYQVREEKAENAAQGWQLGFSRIHLTLLPYRIVWTTTRSG